MYGVHSFNEMSISAHSFGYPPTCNPPITYPLLNSNGCFGGADTSLKIDPYLQNDGLIHFTIFNCSNSTKKLSKIYWFMWIVELQN